MTLSVMQTAEALERIAYELAMDAAADGVRYIEVRYAPVLNIQRGLSLGEAVESPLRGLERAEREGGALARVIVAIGRVPFLFYVAHIMLLHLMAVAVAPGTSTVTTEP